VQGSVAGQVQTIQLYDVNSLSRTSDQGGVVSGEGSLSAVVVSTEDSPSAVLVLMPSEDGADSVSISVSISVCMDSV
jgi:hypothetical protein